MTDTPDLNPYDFGLAHLLLPASVDENPLLDATQRWQDCCKDMRELMAGTPAVRTVVNQMLQEHLQLDGERVGLRFFATQTRSSNTLSINNACLYMQQHPSLDTSQVPQGTLLNLPDSHRFSGYTVPMLLDELKRLDLEQAIKDAWTRYLNNRAPNQPVSCGTRAAELYKIHFEASGEAILAQGSISATALNPMFAIIDPLLAEPGAEKIYTEQIVLKPSAGEALVLPGSWVLTLDTEQPVSQLLYLPAHQPTWRTFANRTDMERWLIDQQQVLFSTSTSDPLATIDYRLKTGVLETGISDWLNLLADAQYREAIKPVPGIEIENAPLARAPIDAFDSQRQSQTLFALAPEPPTPPTFEEEGTLSQFGLLDSSLPLSQRQARVLQQRTALDTLLGEGTPAANRDTRLQQFKQKLDNLRVQQDASAVAARLMLERRTSDFTTLNLQFTALYAARVAGLRIEAQIQQALNQISADELRMLEAILDSPVAENGLVEVAAYSMSLSVTENTNATKKITESELKGPLVITAATTSESTPPSAASYLVYWPGTGGALQRFASRQALQEALFNIAPQDDQLALVLKELTDNPFEYSLRLQQVDFEEHVAHLRSTYYAPEDADKLAASLKKLREETLEKLLVPEHSAREAAFLEIVEQNNSSHLAEKLPTWLVRQTEEQRERLIARLKAYMPALKRAHALTTQSLPSRDAFVKLEIDTRLRKDFSITKGFTVQLDLPDSTRDIQDPVTGGSGVGGTAVKITSTPSLKRSKMSLAELALRNIDTSMGKRLHYMTPDVTADDTAELNRLKVGIDAAYLIKMVRDLNVAKAYETRIYQTFRGTTQESTFQRSYRRECLIEPLRLMLQIQGQLAFMQNRFNADELQVWEAAIDADTREAWEVGTKRIALLPATLVDNSDNNRYGTVTLSGISFIEEKTSRMTILYLPDAPDNQCLRRFDSLELARRKLFDLCQTDIMVKYVAGRALTGEVRSHINRINQATTKNFDAIIGVGFPWPVTTSLAAHQLDAHMGRLIESNRNVARSNEDLADEKHALKTGILLNGIKIALGFLPLIGTAVSLADGVTSLYKAVDALRKGEVHHGIEQLASVFDCLVYAGMDAATFGALPARRPATASALTRQHQLKPTWRPAFWRNLKSRRATTSEPRFAGYEYDQPIEVGSLQTVQTGPYRHTLRHTSGEHLIADGGRYFKVKFEPTAHEMRLVAKGKAYSPVIVFDETQQWNTYSALHGGHLTGYGGGSGRGRGRGASGAGPSRPAAVEQLMPASASKVTKQRRSNVEELNNMAAEFHKMLAVTNQKLKELADIPVGSPQATTVYRELSPHLAQVLEKARQLYAACENPTRAAGKHAQKFMEFSKNYAAFVGTDYSIHMLGDTSLQLIKIQSQINDIRLRLTELPLGPAFLTLSQELRHTALLFQKELNQQANWVKQIRTWFDRLTPEKSRRFRESVTQYESLMSEEALLNIAIMQYLDLLGSTSITEGAISLYLQLQLADSRQKLTRTLATHLALPETDISKAQHNQILRNSIETYEQFHRDLNAWNTLSPGYFEEVFCEPLLEQLSQLTEIARSSIKKERPQPKPKPSKQVFDTEDGQLLVGTEQQHAQPSPRRFIISDKDGKPVEVWDEISDSKKYRLNETESPARPVKPPLPTDLTTLVNEASNRLNGLEAFQKKVRSYDKMDPASLEHMLSSEAQALDWHADQIQRLSPQHPLIEQLRSHVQPLRTAGKNLRIQRSLNSPKPTEGYLDYLLQEDRVVIRKQDTRKLLKNKRPDGQADYLQEYTIHDKTKPTTQPPIWVAHFHYVAQDSAFDSFVKAHLKTRAQRSLGMTWQKAEVNTGASFADVEIWRGNINKPFAKQHFEDLK